MGGTVRVTYICAMHVDEDVRWTLRHQLGEINWQFKRHL